MSRRLVQGVCVCECVYGILLLVLEHLDGGERRRVSPAQTEPQLLLKGLN